MSNAGVVMTVTVEFQKVPVVTLPSKSRKMTRFAYGRLWSWNQDLRAWTGVDGVAGDA